MADELRVFPGLFAELARHCRNPNRGACVACAARSACDATLVPLVDALMNEVLALEKSERDLFLARAGTKASSQLGAYAQVGKLPVAVSQLSAIVMECGRIKPIDTIDGAIKCLKPLGW